VVQVERLGFGFLPGFAAPATGEISKNDLSGLTATLTGKAQL